MMELYSLYLWLGAGAILLVLEISGLSGIGFLFAGLACFLVAVLLYLDVVAAGDYLAQFAWFFAFTVFWGIALWKPLQRFLNHPQNSTPYSDMIGQTATVSEGGLIKGHNGKARWSGTIMAARIGDGVHTDSIPEGAPVEIIGVQGTTLLVKPK